VAITEIRVDHGPESADVSRLKRELGTEFDEAPDVRTADVYYVEGMTAEEADKLAAELLVNPVTQTARIGSREDWKDPTIVERTDRAGLINPNIDTIITSATRSGHSITGLALGTEFLFGENTPPAVIERIIQSEINKEIQEVRTTSPATLQPENKRRPTEFIAIGNMNDDQLEAMSMELDLGLSLPKMKAAREEARKNGGVVPEGSLRLLGPYWSDHCRHETFNADLIVNGKKEPSLYAMIKGEPGEFYEEQSVLKAFEGNAAAFEFHTDKYGRRWAVNLKGETHNHPTMLEAYGGVATGVGGLLRDIVKTLKGAKPIATLVSMGMGSKSLSAEKLPQGLQTPWQILKRSVKAVSQYGNRVGVGTMDFMTHSHDGYRGKPVFLGVSIGIMEEWALHEELPRVGDICFAIGNKTGIDGVGGATGSSAASNTETLAKTSEVQTPNAFEEKKMFAAFYEAAERGLVRAATDCGAGGIGLAAGELGEDIGLDIDIFKLHLKAGDFDAWMKAISESQERGVVAVAPEFAEEFMALFAKHDSSAVAIGTFGAGGDQPRYTIRHGDELVSDWSYDFLKNGIPTLQLEADYIRQDIPEIEPQAPDIAASLHSILAHDDICSAEPMIRQFDHEVQGMNVLKPFTGVHMDAPNYASVLSPLADENVGIVFAHSAHPRVTDLDPRAGTAWVVDDLMARIVAVGGNPMQVKINNNYISPRPTKQVAGMLRESVIALREKLAKFKTKPFTGKDSCSGQHTDEHGNTIMNPYNLSLAGISKVEDITETISADIKRTNSTLVLVGNIDTEGMGGSIFYDTCSASSGRVPQNRYGDMDEADYYLRVHDIVHPDTALSCGVVGKGGLAVTISKMLFGGDCGAVINLPVTHSAENFLFSETAGSFVIEVPSETNIAQVFEGLPYQVLGTTDPQKTLHIKAGGTGMPVLHESIDVLKHSWKGPNERAFA
jgi:phosphoribosylformylglycinamidine synthase II